MGCLKSATLPSLPGNWYICKCDCLLEAISIQMTAATRFRGLTLAVLRPTLPFAFCLLPSLADRWAVDFCKRLFSWFPPWQLNWKASLIDCTEIQALTCWHKLSPTDKPFLLTWNENSPDRYEQQVGIFLHKTRHCSTVVKKIYQLSENYQV